MSTNPFSPDRRWYDQRPQVSNTINLMVSFPPEIQTIIGEGIVYLADKEFLANEQMHALKSLGSEKTLGLYRSKSKKRDYDNNPLLHKIINYLYVLSEKNQDFMAKQVMELVIQDYFNTVLAEAEAEASADVHKYKGTKGDVIEEEETGSILHSDIQSRRAGDVRRVVVPPTGVAPMTLAEMNEQEKAQALRALQVRFMENLSRGPR